MTRNKRRRRKKNMEEGRAEKFDPVGDGDGLVNVIPIRDRGGEGNTY